MASPIRRSGRLQLAEIMKRPKVHAAHVDLVDDDEDSVEDRGADGNDNAGSDVSGDDAVIAGDEGGNAEEETDSDDAFDDPPQKTSTDPSPSASRKNVATRREVVRIGFGSMLKIKLTELPAKLGYWVVKKFNPRSSSIELADGTKVRVTVDDIRHVLGLPCGRAKVVSKKGEKCDILDQLRVEIGSRYNKITPLELSEKVLQYTDGGVWFVRLFVLLVVSVLVDSSSHGYVNNWVLKSLEDVDGIAQLNWCEYVHRSLIDSRVKWEKGKRKYYTGPLLCLLILRDRENNEVKAGGFGLGYDDGRFVGEVVDASSGDTDVGAGLEQDNVENGNGDAPEPRGETRDDPVEVFVQKFAEKGRILATTIIDLVSLIESAPPGTMENDVFKQLQLAAGRLLGLAQRRVLARSKYKKIMEDMPSLSLGFSQLDGENENVNIDGGDMGACRNTPSTPVVRVVNEPESNPGVENDFITPGEVQCHVGDAVDMDLAGGNRNQPDRIGMTAVAGVSAVGDGTVRGTFTEHSKAEVKPCNAARKLARTLKPAGPLRSPYLTRPIDLSDGLSVMERRVTNWVLQNPNAPKDEAVFVKDGLELTRVDVSEANVKNMFANALLPAWDDMADDFNWGKAELNWAYVLCVDLKSRRCDILDSSSAKAKNEDRYGDMPKRVRNAKRITLPWRDPKATFDYGVATMRHMETYMGDGGKGWHSGLSKINQKPMLLLRCKYCACILLSPVNALLDKVYAESEKLERERKGKDPK
ncbi:unnamed protein product [Cuscuta campestris]|uniref:Aminotransferase-like plant mobile domain-containing protein n=1 Tax=Cuscuta campestris TaxID=132261 RepID=A0A484LRM2_9ASTE|nr:unnamed protein product [Cuscuta campestris]